MAGECVAGSDRLAGWTGDWDATMLAEAKGGTSGESWRGGEGYISGMRQPVKRVESGLGSTGLTAGSPTDLARTSSVCNFC